ncbi:MAG: hypothetical protein KC931_08985 [Candidatus Omnitrophica bacterium]|nr:hypothetical protein [Candidatus Omnitrophota bacterium]MCA9447240.1 hypothetical protein [Candidatus Omnitrophota bacterium]
MIRVLCGVVPWVALTMSSAPAQDWRPVRVARDSEGWPHFFEVWREDRESYSSTVLSGYANLAFTFPLDETRGVLDDLSKNHGNFTRLWVGAGDGFSAYRFDAVQRKVDLDHWNDDFFDRLDLILSEAEKRGVVVEVMLWDRCTWWIGGGLSTPESWRKGIGHDRGQNPFHPDNHYRSSVDGKPVPGVVMKDTRRIEADPFYNTENDTWMVYQKRYMSRILEVLKHHNNVTVELINEAPATKAATDWRKYMHTWLKSEYPDLLVQSESLGADRDLASWGRDHPGRVDMTASHDDWSYDSAQAFYHKYKGVLPGCNEYIHQDLTDMSRCRRMMWGLTMGGGASWNENITPPNGSILTQEIHRFFNPEHDSPRIGLLRPAKDRIIDNDGSKYVLAPDDASEILVYISEESGAEPFKARGIGSCRFRWFTCAGKDSVWGDWDKCDTGAFTPPTAPCGLQIRLDEKSF